MLTVPVSPTEIVLLVDVVSVAVVPVSALPVTVYVDAGPMSVTVPDAVGFTAVTVAVPLAEDEFATAITTVPVPAPLLPF